MKKHLRKYWWVYLAGLVAVGAYSEQIIRVMQVSGMLTLQIAGAVFLFQLVRKKFNKQEQKSS